MLDSTCSGSCPNTDRGECHFGGEGISRSGTRPEHYERVEDGSSTAADVTIGGSVRLG